MDRLEIIKEWWRLNSGAFINLEEVLPFIVCHKLPASTDRAPTPMLIGAQAMQASVIGTHDPAAFREILARAWGDYSSKIILTHRRVAESGEPDITTGAFPADLTGKGFAYRRGLFPVATITGHRMLLTYTTVITSH